MKVLKCSNKIRIWHVAFSNRFWFWRFDVWYNQILDWTHIDSKEIQKCAFQDYVKFWNTLKQWFWWIFRLKLTTVNLVEEPMKVCQALKVLRSRVLKIKLWRLWRQGYEDYKDKVLKTLYSVLILRNMHQQHLFISIWRLED